MFLSELDNGKIEETIKKIGSQYELVSHTGKNLGKYSSRAGAEHREDQVNFFKHAKKHAKEEVETEARIIDKDALIDVYYNTIKNNKQQQLKLAKAIPQSTLDLLVKGLRQKYDIDPEKVEWRPSEYQHYSKISESAEEFVHKFLPWIQQELELQDLPKIVLLDKPETKSFGTYGNGELRVVVGNRHPVDVLRTMSHELTHYKQDIEGRLNHESGETGSDEENEANANAGVIMRQFAQNNPEEFGLTENIKVEKLIKSKAITESANSVKEMISLIRFEKPTPQVVVTKDYTIVEGADVVEAYRRLGIDTIRVTVVESTKIPSFKRAVGAKQNEPITNSHILRTRGRINTMKASKDKRVRARGIQLERQMNTFVNTHKKKNPAVGAQ